MGSARIARILFIAVALTAWGAAPDSAVAAGDTPVLATGSRVAGDEEHTRFVVDLSRKVDFDVFALAEPARLVIDLPEVVFQMDASAGQEGTGLVSAYRYGLFAPGKSRIVLDLSDPVEIDESFVIEAEDGQPARLVLDLVKTDRDSFLADIALQDRQRPKAASAGTSSEPAPKKQAGRRVIVIDPGHGGIDPGAISPKGTREKDVVLAVSRKLKEELERTGRFTVLLTRGTDVFIPLGERVRYAREHNAELFISVHADSVRKGEVNGATVYTLSDRASDSMAAELAEQENASDALAGVELQEESDAVVGILLDLMQRETKTLSIHFARTLVDGLKRDVDMVRNPHRHAGFRVLKAHDVPSVLLELGYLSSRQDEKRLLDSDWQEEVSETVSRVVERFFGDRQARSPF